MDLFCRRTEILQTIYARRREKYETLAFEFNVDISTIGRTEGSQVAKRCCSIL